MIAITTKNSTRVNPWVRLFFCIIVQVHLDNGRTNETRELFRSDGAINLVGPGFGIGISEGFLFTAVRVQSANTPWWDQSVRDYGFPGAVFNTVSTASLLRIRSIMAQNGFGVSSNRGQLL